MGCKSFTSDEPTVFCRLNRSQHPLPPLLNVQPPAPDGSFCSLTDCRSSQLCCVACGQTSVAGQKISGMKRRSVFAVFLAILRQHVSRGLNRLPANDTRGCKIQIFLNIPFPVTDTSRNIPNSYLLLEWVKVSWGPISPPQELLGVRSQYLCSALERQLGWKYINMVIDAEPISLH